MRNADGQGFDSPQVHVNEKKIEFTTPNHEGVVFEVAVANLTEEQEKDLDEMAKRFARTKGGNK